MVCAYAPWDFIPRKDAAGPDDLNWRIHHYHKYKNACGVINVDDTTIAKNMTQQYCNIDNQVCIRDMHLQNGNRFIGECVDYDTYTPAKCLLLPTGEQHSCSTQTRLDEKEYNDNAGYSSFSNENVPSFCKYTHDTVNGQIQSYHIDGLLPQNQANQKPLYCGDKAKQYCNAAQYTPNQVSQTGADKAGQKYCQCVDTDTKYPVGFYGGTEIPACKGGISGEDSRNSAEASSTGSVICGKMISSESCEATLRAVGQEQYSWQVIGNVQYADKGRLAENIAGEVNQQLRTCKPGAQQNTIVDHGYGLTKQGDGLYATCVCPNKEVYTVSAYLDMNTSNTSQVPNNCNVAKFACEGGQITACTTTDHTLAPAVPRKVICWNANKTAHLNTLTKHNDGSQSKSMSPYSNYGDTDLDMDAA